jgi:hypothetical protein
VRDPNTTGLWIGIGALVVLCVPYPFSGSAEPLMLGVPLWFLVTIVASVALVALTNHGIRRWDLSALADERANDD